MICVEVIILKKLREKIFMINMISKKMNFMEKALDAYWVKNEVVSNNIANVDTPGYKKYKVNFEELLSEKREQFSIAANYKNPKFLPIGRDKARMGEVMVTRDFSTSMRKDGNNVDIDVENAELAKNSLKYNIVSNQLAKELSLIKQAINGGR